jgi:triosephosphate isomerase
MRRKLVVGNWKMHGSRPANAELLAGILPVARPSAATWRCACRSRTCRDRRHAGRQRHALGRAGLSAHEQGAYTGEVSAPMLAEFGCRYAIVGHSERRAYHAESDQLVADKAKAALAKGITPIVCVGETLASAKPARPKRWSSASSPP